VAQKGKEGWMKQEQLSLLKGIAQEGNYGWGASHAEQVNRLALRIYDDLLLVGMLEHVGEDRELLSAAAFLHDIGRPEEPHNEVAFKMLNKEIPKRMVSEELSREDLSILLYCILFHRGHDFSERKEVPLAEPVRSKQLGAILRIADGLDYGPPFDAAAKEVGVKKLHGTIVCQVKPSSEMTEGRVRRYVKHVRDDKIDLFGNAFGHDMAFEVLNP